jgi:serine/threonine protein kinase
MDMQGSLKWPAIAHVLIDVLRGLKYLHELEVIHGDIKAANVMLKSVHRSVSSVRFTAKLADLGLAQLRNHSVRPRPPSPPIVSILAYTIYYLCVRTCRCCTCAISPQHDWFSGLFVCDAPQQIAE